MTIETAPKPQEYFQVTRIGDVAVIIPAPEVESIPSNLIDAAAELVLAPLKQMSVSNVVFDLAHVTFFGSEFISFLLKCHLIMKKQHGDLVLAGVSDRIRELLRQTALDTLWAIYDDRNEALAALGSD